jgi:hypothetical protein
MCEHSSSRQQRAEGTAPRVRGTEHACLPERDWPTWLGLAAVLLAAGVSALLSHGATQLVFVGLSGSAARSCPHPRNQDAPSGRHGQRSPPPSRRRELERHPAPGFYERRQRGIRGKRSAVGAATPHKPGGTRPTPACRARRSRRRGTRGSRLTERAAKRNGRAKRVSLITRR